VVEGFVAFSDQTISEPDHRLSALTYTQAQIDALTALIASGVNSAGYGDKRTEFRSLADLRQILNDMNAQVNGTTVLRQIRVTSPPDKGL
jgi:hypothetical protein